MTEPRASTLRLPVDAYTGFMKNTQQPSTVSETAYPLHQANGQVPEWKQQFLALGHLLSLAGRDAWHTLLEDKNLVYLKASVLLLSLSPRGLQILLEIGSTESTSLDGQILKRLTPVPVNIPEGIWTLVDRIALEETKEEFLRSVDERLHLLPPPSQKRPRSAFPTQIRSEPGDFPISLASTTEHNKTETPVSHEESISLGSKRSKQSTISTRRRPIGGKSRKSEEKNLSQDGLEERFYCPEPYCHHQPNGFAKKGSCINHVSIKHQSFTKQYPDWESFVVGRPGSSDNTSQISSDRVHKRPRLKRKSQAGPHTPTAINGIGDKFSNNSPISSQGESVISPRVLLLDQHMRNATVDHSLFSGLGQGQSTPADTFPLNLHNTMNPGYGSDSLASSSDTAQYRPTPGISVTPPYPAPWQRLNAGSPYLGIQNSPNYGSWSPNSLSLTRK